jgi:hypothetical protein
MTKRASAKTATGGRAAKTKTKTRRGGLNEAIVETVVTVNAFDLGNAFVDTLHGSEPATRNVEAVPKRGEPSANWTDIIKSTANDASVNGERELKRDPSACESLDPYAPGTSLDPDADFSAVRHVVPLVVRNRMEVKVKPTSIDPALVQFCRGCRRTLTTNIHFISHNKTCCRCLERQRLKRKQSMARRR